MGLHKPRGQLREGVRQTATLLHTLTLKIVLPLVSVWSKTTLNTDGVGGARADPHT